MRLFLIIVIVLEYPISSKGDLTNSRLHFKTWNKNTNFENLVNWDGYERNCSKNIYAFPMDMDSMVISIPPNTTLSTKQIILPRNGHLVFQKGSTVLLNLPSETCQGTELKFRRTVRGDWFDPNNWNGNDSLLNSEAIPHVERVPCQYDSVQFPSQSSFHLFISRDVKVHKFFLGEEELNYTNIAFLMSSQLGKLQFQKDAETQFSLNDNNWEDNDKFICKNYENPQIIKKICDFMKCKNLDEECGNPITPLGFCCPICGYLFKIQHNGKYPLAPVKEKLESRMKSLLGIDVKTVGVSIGRHAPKLAHIIIYIPSTLKEKRKNVEKIIDEIRIFLNSEMYDKSETVDKPIATSLRKLIKTCRMSGKCSTHLEHTNQESSIERTTFVSSYEDANSNRLESTGLSGGVTFLIVFFVIFIIGITAFLIFLWTKRGYPPITLQSILSRLPPMPGVSTGGDGSPRPSFSFARFSNERISTINIGATASGEIQRTEKVDTDAKPIEINVPLEVGPEGAVGYTNVTYDLCDFGESVNVKPSTSESGISIPNEDDHIYDLVEVGPPPHSGPTLQTEE